MSYSFRDREVAEELKRIANQSRGRTNNPRVPTGCEVVIAKVPEEGIEGNEEPEEPEEGAEPENPSLKSALCTMMYVNDTGEEPELVEDEDVKLTVFNKGKDKIDGGSIIYVARVGVHWHAVTSTGGGGGKRIKFKLIGNILTSGTDMSGFAEAEVIDPLNSGLDIGSATPVTVWDYKKQFPMAVAGAIGMAYLGDPFQGGAGEQWHIEQVEQLANKVRVTGTESLSPWLTDISNGDIESIQSVWPYNMLSTDLQTGASIEMRNHHRFTANQGWFLCDLIIPEAYMPDPSNTVAPYSLEPLSPVWNITDVQYKTARWVGTEFDGSDFKISGSEFAEGAQPYDHDEIAAGDIANPPETLWDSIDLLSCHISEGTRGWAFLDDNEGVYKTICTESAFFGMPTVVEGVLRDQNNSEELIREDEFNCGRIKYESVANVLVWGNPTGTTGCKMSEVEPDKYFDLFSNNPTVTVVTGVEVAPFSGELQFTTMELKGCATTAGPLPIPHQTTDVVTDVYCADGSVSKDYKTIKFMGSVENENNGIALPCTDPDNFDWQFIFENHVYNEDWWNIDYYDITYPEGCEPCPCTCCEQTLLDETVQVVTVADRAECLASVNSNPVLDTDVVSAECVDPSECDGGVGCCDGLTLSQADFGVPTAYSTGSNGDISFTASSIVDNGSCSWTLEGQWSSNFSPSTPTGTIDITYSELGSIWEVSGDIPAPYGGSVGGMEYHPSCDAQTTTLDILISGTHEAFNGPGGQYSGDIRISFTQTG